MPQLAMKANIIGLLKMILKDQYNSRAILKELIQNADDAGANSFHIGWMPGWQNGTIPLLKGDIVMVLNDGEFKEKDKEGVCAINVGGKSDEPGAIGRFGLGMKSIFHFCESFIYLASENQSAANGNDIVIDWVDPRLDIDTPDQFELAGRIVERIKKWVQGIKEQGHKCEKWFCILIPLRRQEHFNGNSPIINEFPKIGDFVQPDTQRRITLLTPLLKSLNSFMNWNWDSENKRWNKEWEVRLDDDHRLNRTTFPDITDEKQIIKGRFLPKSSISIFIGLEAMTQKLQEKANKLKNDAQENNKWPMVPTLDGNDMPANATPHCAAIFSIYPKTNNDNGAASLTLRHAVFLPLSTIIEDIDCSGNFSFQLLLHGYFFLDAGRRQVYQSPKKDKVEDEWNRLLQEEGVFKLILPALDKFSKKLDEFSKINERSKFIHIKNLTSALCETNLIKNKPTINLICSEKQWLPCICVDDNGFFMKWKLLDADESFVELPYAESFEIVANTFPKLKDIVQNSDCIVTFDKITRITNKPPNKWCQNHPNQLEKLLKSLNHNIFLNLEYISYLLKFLAKEHDEIEINEKRILKKLAKNLLMNQVQDVRNDVSLKGKFKEFIRYINENEWVSLSHVTPEYITLTIYNALIKRETNQLLIPDDLTPDNQSGGFLDINSSRRLLEELESIGGAEKRKIGIAALQIIKKTEGDLETKQRDLGNYKVIYCKRYSDKDKQLKAWNKLSIFNENSQLFQKGSDFASPMQQCISGIHYYYLPVIGGIDPFFVIFDAPGRVLNQQRCFNILSLIPNLSQISTDRLPIIGNLINALNTNNDQFHVKVIRYLLHGKETKFDDLTPLMTKPQGGDNVLSKIAQHAVVQLNEQWCWLPDDLAGTLPGNLYEKLNIRHFSWQTVEEKLQQAVNNNGIEWIRNIIGDFNQNERYDILKNIQNDHLWRRLPLHQTTNGSLIQVNEHGKNYFPDSNPPLPIPDNLTQNINVIRHTDDDNLNMKYAKILKPWNAKTCLKTICDEPKPHDFANLILGIIQNVETELGADLLAKLKRKTWLPTNGGPRSPEKIIHLPGIQIATIVERTEYFGKESIKDEIVKHDGFSFVEEKLFPDQNESLSRLGQCLQNNEEYYLGNLKQLKDNPHELNKLIKAFQGVNPAMMPAVSLLQSLIENVGPTSVGSHLLPHLLKEIPIEKTIARLNFLSNRHNGNPDPGILEVHNWYLKTFAESDGAHGHLKCLERLLNRNNQWKSPECLCADAPGIEADYLLDSEQGGILKNIYLPNEENTDAPNPAMPRTMVDLEKYFQNWDGFQINKVIGGFLSVLGDIPSETKELAEKYLDHEVAMFRDQIDWYISNQPLPGNWQPQGMGADIHTAMAKQEVKFVSMEGQTTVSVINLIGDICQANIDDNYEHLFIGDFVSSNVGPRCCETGLRFIDPDIHTRDKLIGLLKESTFKIIEQVFYRGDDRRPKNINEIFDSLEKTNQLELEIAQRLILENIFLYFKTIGKNHITLLKEEFRAWNVLRHKREDLNHTLKPGPGQVHNYDKLKANLSSVEEQIGQLYENVKEQINNCPKVQNKLLQATRRKINEDYQYSENSVLFELFQNADDASVELAGMINDAQMSKADVRLDNNKLIFIHWGRRINEYRRGSVDAEQGRDLGYDSDLENMLILSSSEKSQREGMTGKYGLGFKSVFIIADEPRVLSGQLGFKIKGGFFPKRLESAEKTRLEGYVNQKGPANSATIFELSPNEDHGQNLQTLINQFKNLTPPLLVFSRKIKELIFDGTPVVWHEKKLNHCQNVYWGHAPRIGQVSNMPQKFLVLRSNDNGALLLGIGNDGICKLPDDIPTLWVTAPTNEKLNMGFAVNGSFALDIGRAQLAADPAANEENAKSLGSMLAKALRELHEATSENNWSAFCEELGIASSKQGRYGFWSKIWELFAKAMTAERLRDHNGGSVSVLKTLLWGESGAMRGLLDSNPAMPTGLPGKYEDLVLPSDVETVITGILDENVDILQTVLQWSSVQEGIATPGKTASKKRAMGILCPDAWNNQPTELRLEDIIEKEIVGFNVSLDTAKKLGSVVTRQKMEIWESKNLEHRGEVDHLRDFLQNLKFLARNGHYVDASNLKTMSEIYGSGLPQAIDNQVLHKYYDTNGLKFFEACRPGGRTISFYIPESIVANNPQDEIAKRLNNIYKWWKRHRQNQLLKYENCLYVHAQFPVSSFELNGTDDRQGWLKLFLYGIVQTLGRTRIEAGRDFIQLCENEGWIQNLCQLPIQSEEWLKNLYAYIQKQTDNIPFYQWIKLLFGLFVVARKLEDYVKAFEAINNMGDFGNLNQITNPLTNRFFQGGGPDAPPISRILGIGAWFMLRELVRNGLITEEAAFPHCFVPFKRVQNLIVALGGPQLGNATREEQSIRIHDFLKEHLQNRATFDQSFDIPLQLIAADKILWNQFVNQKMPPTDDSEDDS